MSTPKPLPTKLLELTQGKLYGKQKERAELEPKPLANIAPRAPIGMGKKEKKEWNFYKKILENYGLYNMACAPTLAMLCHAVVRLKECADTVAETGLMIKGKDNLPVENPYWTAMLKLEKQIVRYHQELALSNTGLAKIGSLALKARNQKSELEEMLD